MARGEGRLRFGHPPHHFGRQHHRQHHYHHHYHHQYSAADVVREAGDIRPVQGGAAATQPAILGGLYKLPGNAIELQLVSHIAEIVLIHNFIIPWL